MKSPILGQAYTARSANAAADRLINLYAEVVASGGKEAAYLTRTPGTRLLRLVAAGKKCRGMWNFGGKGYAVFGNLLYSFGSDWVCTQLGYIYGHDPVQMVDNGYQLFVAAGGRGYIYNATTAVFAEITDYDFPGADTVAYLDGYFIFNEPDSQRFFISSPLDGTAIDALDYASAEGFSDNLVAVAVDHRELWLFGESSVEVWYNSGDATFPITRISGAFIETGCQARLSIAKIDNALFWLGSDRRGSGMIYRANGYSPVRVSTHAVEYAIQGYETTSDARAYTYQQEGHSFYVINFPTAGKTWCYDASTGMWHERAGFAAGEFANHSVVCAMNFAGEIVCGDNDGNLLAYDLDVFTDNSNPIKWLRAWRMTPTGQNNMKRSIWRRLELDCEAGVGNSGDTEAPQIMLRTSDDGGHTWIGERWASMGKIGEHYKRVFWTRLGATLKRRDRVAEISGTDPVKIAIIGAEVDAELTNA